MVSARRPVGGPWDSPTFLSGEDDWAAVPLVAMGRAGTTTVVWALHTFPGDYFHYRSVEGVQRAPEGAWGEVQTVSNGPPVNPTRAFQMAMDAQDGVVVVWTQVDGTTPRVMVTTS